MPNILFVCDGNTCRSPMAEALLKQELATRGLQGFSVSSCGLHVHRDRVDAKLPLVLGKTYENIKDSRPRQISAQLLGQADVVLTMEESQAREILANFPDSLRKTSTVAAYVGQAGEIEDYVGHGPDDFLTWLENSCYRLHKFVLEIVNRLEEPSDQRS